MEILYTEDIGTQPGKSFRIPGKRENIVNIKTVHNDELA